MKIICIGRNYSAHAKEMNSPLPSSPVFFLKPETALLRTSNFYYPKFTNKLHYECEIVVRIDKVGKNIQKKFASTYYSEFTLGIDFTARDIQEECKQSGLPWEKAKGFDQSAPVSSQWLKVSDYPDGIDFTLKKNDSVVQSGSSTNMIFSFDDIICYISSFITLKKGDLIFTGTPAGVGEVEIGDSLNGYVRDERVLSIKVK